MLEWVGTAVGALCLPLLLIEQVLAAKWNSVYFRSGMPLWWRSVAYSGRVSLETLEDELSLTFERRFWQPLVFRRLDADAVAFRERFWPFPIFLDYYLPLLHGIITRVDPQRIEVVGKTNWAAPLLCVAVGLRIYHEAPEMTLVWLGFFCVMYLLQGLRFRHVARVAAVVRPEEAA